MGLVNSLVAGRYPGVLDAMLGSLVDTEKGVGGIEWEIVGMEPNIVLCPLLFGTL